MSGSVRPVTTGRKLTTWSCSSFAKVGRRQPEFCALCGQSLRSLALRHGNQRPKLICLYADRKLQEGQTWKQESIVGTS